MLICVKCITSMRRKSPQIDWERSLRLMVLRKSNWTIFPIMGIAASSDLYEENGIDQWQNGYPDENTIKDDINNGYGYVLPMKKAWWEQQRSYFTEKPMTRSMMEVGWPGQLCCRASGSVSLACRNTGAAAVMISVSKMCLERKVYSMKIDTHEDNLLCEDFSENVVFSIVE